MSGQLVPVHCYAVPSKMSPKFFKTPDEFRQWLSKHHDKESELLVGFYKKDSGKKEYYVARVEVIKHSAIGQRLPGYDRTKN